MSYEISKKVYDKLVKIVNIIDSEYGEYENEKERDTLEGIILPIIQATQEICLNTMFKGGGLDVR